MEGKSSLDNTYWAEKFHLVQRHAHEYHQNPLWFAHEKHVLIFTFTGRPIFSKYGDESKLAEFVGIISALIANTERLGDTQDHFVSGKYNFVFYLHGPLYFVSITNSDECLSVLKSQLWQAKEQIISVLGGTVLDTLREYPNYDIRPMLTGTELLMQNVLNLHERFPFVYDVQPLRMQKQARVKTQAALKKYRPKAAQFALIISGHRVVAAKHKDAPMAATDLLLLASCVANSQSFRSGEAWSPIVQPAFDATKFMYMYVHFVRPTVALVFVCTDPLGFDSCSAAKSAIVAALGGDNAEDGDLAEIEVAAALQAWPMAEIEGGSELVHFAFRNLALGQIVSADVAPVMMDSGMDMRSRARALGIGSIFEAPVEPDASLPLLEALQQNKSKPESIAPQPTSQCHLYSQVFSSTHKPLETPSTVTVAGGAFTKPEESPVRYPTFLQHSSQASVLFFHKPKEFELYVVLYPQVSKEAALGMVHRIVRWVKREEASLFLQP